jgi:hypothetical protein
MEKELKKEILELIDERFKELASGTGVKKTPLIPNPKFKPSYKPNDDVDLIANEGAPHHEAGEKFTVKGHQATIFIQKGVAKLDDTK